MEEYYGFGVVGMKFLLMAYYQVVMLFLRWFPNIRGCPVRMGANDCMSFKLYSACLFPAVLGVTSFSCS